MKPNIRLALILLAGAVFLLSSWGFLGTLADYRQGAEHYDTLDQYVSYLPVTPTAPALSPALTEPVPQTTPPLIIPEVDFASLGQLNPDLVGWIYLEGTGISYPVVQGQDNDHYLTHLFDGTKNRAGCVFLDYRCSTDLSDRSSILYGHHLRDGTMFTPLMNYKHQDFYDAHPTGLLLTPENTYEIHFFSGYVTDNHSSAWDMELGDDAHAQWLDSISRKSYFSPHSVPDPDDRILTLSTCTYEFDDAKFVLHGYLTQID